MCNTKGVSRVQIAPDINFEQFQVFKHLLLKQIYVSLSISGADYLHVGAQITFQVKYNVYYRTNKTIQI